MIRRVSSTAFVLGVLVLAMPVHAGDCDTPTTCTEYRLNMSPPARWPSSSDDIVRIQYRVWPVQSAMSESAAIAAIRAGFATWEAWNPRIDFVYMGRSDRPPILKDGNNTIGFQPALPNSASSRVSDHPTRRLVEFDIFLNMFDPWVWEPCAQANNSCTPGSPYYYVPGAPFGGPYNPHGGTDLQEVVTHEAGHALGLGDLPAHYCHLTMNGGLQTGGGACELNNRRRVTLGLGDILGAKALYPWSCPGGTNKARSQYPVKYQRVCPSIQVFSP